MPTNDNNDDVKYATNGLNKLRKHGRYGAYMNPQDSFNVPKKSKIH